MKFSSIREEQVVVIPRVDSRSLSAIGTPSRGPRSLAASLPLPPEGAPLRLPKPGLLLRNAWAQAKDFILDVSTVFAGVCALAALAQPAMRSFCGPTCTEFHGWYLESQRSRLS